MTHSVRAMQATGKMKRYLNYNEVRLTPHSYRDGFIGQSMARYVALLVNNELSSPLGRDGLNRGL
jgi:hypothetical protein